jgi:Leucine-rich repeat (LRR) protein
MKKKDVTDRLSFLAEQFDVFTCGDDKEINDKKNSLIGDGYTPSPINGLNGDSIIAIYSYKVNEKDRILKKISICSDVFTAMIIADPTENKMYLQWMLNLFSRLIKDGKINNLEAAIRLVNEDLPQANNYLTLFEENKRKRKFKELCKGSYILKGITDPTDINQYKSLSQLFDAVDPFIEKDASAIERTLMKFVESGQAEIPVHDRKYMVYIPKTTDASVVFAKHANWCTAREGNGMFKSYTEAHLKPNGQKSEIYIIINNKFFTGESEEIYQIHFESNQLKDKRNGQNVSIFENVLSESEGITNFFYERLMVMAKSHKNGMENNRYLDYLIQFGFAESLFELMDERTPAIKFMNREIPRLPDISRFQTVDQIVITDANMVELHESVGNLTKLEMLVLTNNKIKALPKEIGALKNLEFINLSGNPVQDFPDTITNLDKSHGGSLLRIAMDLDLIGEKNYQKLRELLPTTILG